MPDTVLGQLGNRVQHALRAFTPRDQKAVKAAAKTMRAEPEARHRDGDHRTRRPARRWSACSTRRGARASPSASSSSRRPAASARSRADERQALIAGSLVAGIYEKAVDRESAYEKLKAGARSGHSGAAGGAPQVPAGARASSGGGVLDGLKDAIFGTTGPRGGKHEGLAESAARSAMRSIGSSVGRELMRGVLGSLSGGSRRR